MTRVDPGRLLIKPIVVGAAVLGLLLTAFLLVHWRHLAGAPITVRFIGLTNSIIGRRAIFRVHNPSDVPIHVCDWTWQTENGGIMSSSVYPTYGHQPIPPGRTTTLIVHYLQTSQRWRLEVGFVRDQWKRKCSSWFVNKFCRTRFYQYLPERIDGMLMDALTVDGATSDWVDGCESKKRGEN